MPAKQFEKVCRCALMLRARGWRHGQFSFENLIPVAIVGQKDVVLIGENNLPFRNVHGSRHVGYFYHGGILASMNHEPRRASCGTADEIRTGDQFEGRK